jgi:hypothetical protein
LRQVDVLVSQGQNMVDAIRQIGVRIIQLAVRGAPLAQDADWLPAIEQFGEGDLYPFR